MRRTKPKTRSLSIEVARRRALPPCARCAMNGFAEVEGEPTESRLRCRGSARPRLDSRLPDSRRAKANVRRRSHASGDLRGLSAGAFRLAPTEIDRARV